RADAGLRGGAQPRPRARLAPRGAAGPGPGAGGGPRVDFGQAREGRGGPVARGPLPVGAPGRTPGHRRHGTASARAHRELLRRRPVHHRRRLHAQRREAAVEHLSPPAGRTATAMAGPARRVGTTGAVDDGCEGNARRCGRQGRTMGEGTTPVGAETRTLLVLGGSGDLAGRLLLPGLGRLLATGRSPDLRLVGAGVEDWDDTTWRERLREAFAVAPSIEMAPWERFAPLAEEPGAETLRRLERESVYRQADVTRPEDLRSVVGECEAPVAI